MSPLESSTPGGMYFSEQDTYEEIISLDLESTDLFYRVRRGDSYLYVQINAPDIIPRSDRTRSYVILQHLRTLPGWSSEWQTLTVSGRPDSPSCEPDLFHPRRLSPDDIIDGMKRYSLAEFTSYGRICDRIFTGVLNDKECVIKIANFGFELGWLRTELRAYETYRKHGLGHSPPELYGYVYEETPDRVIGFAMERLDGRHAQARDLDQCMAMLERIHG